MDNNQPQSLGSNYQSGGSIRRPSGNLAEANAYLERIGKAVERTKQATAAIAEGYDRFEAEFRDVIPGNGLRPNKPTNPDITREYEEFLDRIRQNQQRGISR